MADHAGTSRKRPSSREAIVDAASHLLARATSRDAVTLRAIARETGIAAPSIYNHFANRDAVVDAVIARTFDEFDAACGRGYHRTGPGAERVHSVCRAYLEFGARRPAQYRILFDRAGIENAGAGPYPSGLHAFQYLAEAVKEAGSETPFADAELLWAALHGLVSLVAGMPQFPWSPTDELLDALLARFLPTTRESSADRSTDPAG